MLGRHRALIMLALIALLIKLFSLDSGAVERYYSNGIYPKIAAVQRIAFGWLPFSFGDLLYGFAGVWLLLQLVRMIKRIKNRRADRLYFKNALLRTLRVALVVYIAFNALWGLNYNRRGIDYQLSLDMLAYSDADLFAVTEKLALHLNALQASSKVNRPKLDDKRYLFNGAKAAYSNISSSIPVLHYSFASVKPSLYSYLGNYLGYTGYYNPFSGEAQINTTVPGFIQPFVTCHEIGHQLGYAKESEANFAGFLSATASEDSAFLYSVYFDMYSYAARYCYFVDSNALKTINNKLLPSVKKDIYLLREFYRKYSNPAGDIIDELYSEYLRANEQPSGKMSYNEVVAMLIAWYKKKGHL